MPYGRSKRDNEYARLVFDIDAPKTVWMALAVSFAQQARPDLTLSMIEATILVEWRTLHANGIVPQKPPRG